MRRKTKSFSKYALTAENASGSDTEEKVAYITVTEPSAWEVITYDDFESGWGNYTDGGGHCRLYTGGTFAPQGNTAANIQDNSGVASSFYHTDDQDVQKKTPELEKKIPGEISAGWLASDNDQPSDKFECTDYIAIDPSKEVEVFLIKDADEIDVLKTR